MPAGERAGCIIKNRTGATSFDEKLCCCRLLKTCRPVDCQKPASYMIEGDQKPDDSSLDEKIEKIF
jgi:hypothetical protein